MPNYFKVARNKAGLTMFQAAVKLGVTPSAVGSWENGQTPHLKMVDRLCEVYGLDQAELLLVMKEMAEPAAKCAE